MEMLDKLHIAESIESWHEANTQKYNPLDVRMSSEDAGYIIKELSDIKFDGTRISRKEPEKQLDNWFAKRILRENRVPIEIIKNFVKDSYEALGVPVREVNGKLLVPKISESIFSDFNNNRNIKEESNKIEAAEVSRSFFTAVDKLNKINELRISEDVIDSYSKDGINEVKNIHTNTVNQLMDHNFGHNKENKFFDTKIIRSPAWYASHMKHQLADQIQRVEHVLKGAGDSSLDSNDAQRLYDRLRDELSSDSFPEITITENKVERVLDESELSMVSDDFSTALKDVKRIHKLLNLVNPQRTGGENKTIKVGQIEEIHSNWNRLIGDAVSNEGSYDRLVRDLQKNQIDNLGISKLSGGYNLQAAVHDLVQSKEFRNDAGFQIPRTEQIVNIVDAKVEDGQWGVYK